MRNEFLWVTDKLCFDCRRWVLERKLASSDVPKEEQINLIKDLERKETEFMRLKRHKICVDDFELLTIIGRGAFGEVKDVHDILLIFFCSHVSRTYISNQYLHNGFIAQQIWINLQIWVFARVIYYYHCCYYYYVLHFKNLNGKLNNSIWKDRYLKGCF